MRGQCIAAAMAALLCAAPALTQPLAVQGEGVVQWVSGGVGEAERLALDEARKTFNLELIFADRASGSYLSDVEVSVLDRSGREVLKAVSDGPRLLARLPAGTYKVMATFDGTPQARNVSVPGRGIRTVAIYWTDPAVVASPRDERASRGGGRAP